MKKAACIMLVSIMCVIVFSACASGDDKDGYSTPNRLMEGASPDTSALSLTVYDGTEAKKYHMFDSVEVSAVLKALDEVPVKDADSFNLDDLTYPIYGLEIGDTDGWTIAACWSNGYWISDDGGTYIFDYDFAELAQSDRWVWSYSFDSISAVPCAYWLCQQNGQWNTKFMQEADSLDAPNGIEMTLDDWGEEYVKVNIANKGTENWTYGESFMLQVEIDGVWYHVPTIPGNWGFISIAYELMPGGENEQTYWLDPYGELPSGIYRLVASGLTVEHKI